MSSTDVPDSKLVRLVRSALTHLYDYAYLQSHPLALMLDENLDLDQVSRAQKVRCVLLECIEALRPETIGLGQAEATRTYAILTYRYVDGLSVHEIEGKLTLSRRQVYREHAKGVEAVASLLWDKLWKEGKGADSSLLAAQDTAGDRLEIAQAEVARLQQAVHTESLNLRDVLEGVFNLLMPRIQQTGIQVKVAPARAACLPIVADRVMLRQALLNLLSYALDTVQTDLVVAVSHRGNNLLVDVRESFTVAEIESASTSSLKRKGVGLAVARALIEAQGGRLEIHDRDGQWRAQITLPSSGITTVLVIDDNADMVSLFQRYLGGHEVCVVGATDGEQALRQAAELQPQVITLDVMMPNQDGWDILQRLKSSVDTCHIPVIVCSVLNEPQLALAMGASAYLTKPVSQVELLNVLRRWLGTLRPVA